MSLPQRAAGLYADAVRVLLAAGWDREELLNVDALASLRGLVVTHVQPWGVIFDDQYIAYRDRGLRALQRALLAPASIRKGLTTIYADGSGTTMQKTAGLGVVVEEPGEEALFFAQNIGAGTNNRAELMAIWRGLKEVPDVKRRVLIRSDSEYALGSCTKDWNATANAELIASIRADLKLRRELGGSQVDFRYVAAHQGHEGNEIADRLANVGRKLVAKVTT